MAYEKLCRGKQKCGGLFGLKRAFIGAAVPFRMVKLGMNGKLVELVKLSQKLRHPVLEPLIGFAASTINEINKLAGDISEVLYLDLGVQFEKFSDWFKTLSGAIHVPDAVLNAVCSIAQRARGDINNDMLTEGDLSSYINVVEGLDWVCNALREVNMNWH